MAELTTDHIKEFYNEYSIQKVEANITRYSYAEQPFIDHTADGACDLNAFNMLTADIDESDVVVSYDIIEVGTKSIVEANVTFDDVCAFIEGLQIVKTLDDTNIDY